MKIQIEDVIKKIILILTEINFDKYNGIGEYDYMELDSFTTVKLIIALENEFEIEILDELLIELSEKTVGEFAKIILDIINDNSNI